MRGCGGGVRRGAVRCGAVRCEGRVTSEVRSLFYFIQLTVERRGLCARGAQSTEDTPPDSNVQQTNKRARSQPQLDSLYRSKPYASRLSNFSRCFAANRTLAARNTSPAHARRGT